MYFLTVYLPWSGCCKLTLCFSSSFLCKVMITCHFIMVNTLDMLEFGYLRTWRVSIIRWSPGIICTVVLTGLHAPQLFICPFVYQPTCTTLGLTCAHYQMNRVSGVHSTSLWGGLEWYTHWVYYPVRQRPISETNIRHHANDALNRTHETKHDTTYTSGARATLFRNYTINSVDYVFT